MKFTLNKKFEPINAQFEAINQISNNINLDIKNQTFQGITGSGKTFVIANVIEKIQRPILVLTHNKTLVAQLYQEFKNFFPDNLVEYYVSHFDYYQPESYIPSTNRYIEKDSAINDELNRLRLSTVSSLTSGRRDVIVVSSISCIFGAGNPNNFKECIVNIKKGQKISLNSFLYSLTEASYSRVNDNEFKHGTFLVKGDTVSINSSNSELIYRISFFGDEIEYIETVDSQSKKRISILDNVSIYPATIIVMPKEKANVLDTIRKDMNKQVKYFEKKGMTLEAARLKSRTEYDLEMMAEIGYCNGIENYSRYFDGRNINDRPFCLLDYFDKDFVLVIDESHATLPQVHAMYGGNYSRKKTLVDFGFRLESAYDARPLNFNEFESMLNQTIYVSATPSEYELKKSDGIVTELLVRPTGIIDPPIDIRKMDGFADDILNEIDITIKNNGRVLINAIAKKDAESLSIYLSKIGIKCTYIHSEVKTLDREKILYQLRKGEIDVLIGINLLREGLDLPEVELVIVVDADKEGFLRNYTSLIQIIGRGARNSQSKVIMYANRITDSIQNVINESDRRRKYQIEYNKLYNITPKNVIKNTNKILTDNIKIKEELNLCDFTNMSNSDLLKVSVKLQEIMNIAAMELDFPKAAEYRDKLKYVKNMLNGNYD